MHPPGYSNLYYFISWVNDFWYIWVPEVISSQKEVMLRRAVRCSLLVYNMQLLIIGQLRYEKNTGTCLIDINNS